MDNSKICWPRVLKNIVYVATPIIMTILIFMIICLSYPMEREAVNNRENFLHTKAFAEQYASEIISAFSSVKNFQEDDYSMTSYDTYVTEENVDENNQVTKIYYFYNYYGSNVKWLIIDKGKKEAFTNIDYAIDSTTFEEVKSKIEGKGTYWNYDNANIDTTMPKLKKVNYVDSRLQENNKDAHNYTIYTSLLEPLEYPDGIYQYKIFYNILLLISPNAMYLIPVLVIILIAFIPIAIRGVGKKKGTDQILLNWFDKILVEIAFLLALFIGSIGLLFMSVVSSANDMLTFVVGITFVGVGILIIYLACILFFETVVKRIKTHTLMKTTFAYWVYNKIRNISQNMKITNNFIVYFTIYLVANVISLGILFAQPLAGIILLILVNIYAYKIISDRIKSYNKIKLAINDLYSGKTDIQLNENDYSKEDKTTSKEINDIAGGLSNAINERLKSERLKTELITNVSHDIKTPLTSIINYVDLLKKENIEGEKANEYLGILDNKSQRLKKLTEDLVEASKASSGAIKLNMEKLNVNELIKQISGEFQDKLEAHKLEEIISFPEGEAYIEADSRYLYRVLENMYSNIAKYALEGTRVYIDIIDEDNKIYIKLKNVSKQKLNISADELMQRFVRGEASRNTEGSGLGLSIARSLTELQNGKFNIYLDGDLFKVTIEFEKFAKGAGPLL